MYGTDCSTTFPDRCLSGLCNLEDGICFDCIAGYKGQSCDEGKAEHLVRVIVHLRHQWRLMS